ncbi:hypothetical protein FSP39_009217 [Pinctada imbricata]|uniref:Uncharacterized protein n=1 Tax=Pinctada imbricata TaxID=66713 RepID=A0AA88Y2W5_PINIB|nr:hypothetical protein FSP39_009217 [Pinctada imbricata]
MESFLSPCVHNLITNVGSDNREPCSVQYFLCDGILNQNKLKEILPETAEYFEECTRQLAPVFSQAERLLSRLDTEDYGRQYDQLNTVLGNIQMLDPVLPSGAENQLKEELGENFMDMIHDLLVYPDGPRVRDKLGHGEVDFYDFPEILVKAVILTVCAFVIQKTASSRQTNTCSDQKVFLTSLKEYTRKYNSLFHPVSMVKKKLHDVVELFLAFRNSIKLSPDLQLRTANTVYLNEDHLRGMFLVRSEQATKLCDKLFTTQELSVPREKDTHSFDGRHNSASLRSSEPHISEIVCLLQHIVDEIHTVLRQTTDTLADRQQQFSDHLLRSRQRDNLKKLINSCPFLHQSMLFVSVIVIWQLYNLESQKMTRTKTVKVKVTANPEGRMLKYGLALDYQGQTDGDNNTAPHKHEGQTDGDNNTAPHKHEGQTDGDNNTAPHKHEGQTDGDNNTAPHKHEGQTDGDNNTAPHKHEGQQTETITQLLINTKDKQTETITQLLINTKDK